MAYEDRSLTCVECSQSFTFSADDQTYHAEKGYTNEPKRCPSCRQARRGGQSGGSGGYSDGYSRAPREMHTVVCGQCGKDATVPFQAARRSPGFTVATATVSRADGVRHPDTRVEQEGAIHRPLFFCRS